ncbi:hypothetical protein [Kitasatospora sp. DSM 101779]|uniref:hypothetical protein n=1 Tax=Kitasatospora sp. DSM 101779 TaxID=2853165 RepID=UPI0021D8E188|nr:hypothetical protein [Kitasatospora sp. DSM 101779]MCU7826178.1 hypothetical protein [Kitasatospora sp. DSM 101779]
MRLPIQVHRARGGGREYRVIRPRGAVERAVLVDDDHVLNGWFDRGAARTIGGLWLLAARSPRSLVHVPIRGNELPWAPPAPCGERLDLVLLHHSLQFPPSRWKELRARLGAGAPGTAHLPEAERTAAGAATGAAPEQRHYREFRDRFHQQVAAGTLFMTGSARAFRETADRFLDVARNGPAHPQAHPAYRHYCVEIHYLEGILADGRGLHLEYCENWAA